MIMVDKRNVTFFSLDKQFKKMLSFAPKALQQLAWKRLGVIRTQNSSNQPEWLNYDYCIEGWMIATIRKQAHKLPCRRKAKGAALENARIFQILREASFEHVVTHHDQLNRSWCIFHWTLEDSVWRKTLRPTLATKRQPYTKKPPISQLIHYSNFSPSRRSNFSDTNEWSNSSLGF